MARCIRSILLLLALAIPSQAWAAGSFNFAPSDLGIVNAALNSSPSFTIRTDGYASLTVYVVYTRATASAVRMSCTSGPTPTVQAPLGVASVDGTTGAITMSQAAWTYGVTSNATLRVIISPINDVFAICTFTGTGAASGDVISVYARLGGTP